MCPGRVTPGYGTNHGPHPKDTLESVESSADEHGASRSQFIRDTLASCVGYGEHSGEHAEERIAELEQTVERLRNEKQTLIQDREERTELVRFAETERERRERDRDRKDAPVWHRAKWWVFGRE